MKEMNNKRIYILSALLPMIFTAVVMLIFMYPSADRSIFASDLKDQYINVIAETVYKIKKGESLMYTYKAGFGADWFIMLPAYFNIINLLFLALPIKYYHFAYIAGYILRIGLCGLCACIFFLHSRMIKMRGVWITGLSCMYALCMFNVACSINIFYLNASAILPLCLLCTETIYEKKSIWPFLAVYTISVYNDYWYTSYMTGIACFIYALYYAAVCGKNKKETAAASLKLMLSAAASALLAAVILLPEYNVLKNGYTQVFGSQNRVINYSIPEICRSLLFVADGLSSFTAFPAVFYGILPQFLTICLIISPKTGKKERAAAACICLLGILSLLLTPLYKAFHAFRMPTGFDCRYAYIMAFFCMIFAARSVTLDIKMGKRTKFVPLLVLLLALAAALSHFMNGYYLVCGFVVAVLAVLYTFFSVSEKKKSIMGFFAAAEAFMCMFTGMFVSVRYMDYAPYTQYEKQLANTQKAVSITDKIDGGFYRAADVCNSNLLFQLSAGYNSISTFLSSTNQYASNFARAMGARGVSDGRTVYNSDNSAVNESIFNIKYVYATDKSTSFEDSNGRMMYVPNGARLNSDIYEKIYMDEDIGIYKNKLAFPLMFAAETEVLDIAEKFGGGPGDSFNDTQMFLNAVCGTDEKLYEEIDAGAPVLRNCHFETTPDGEDMIILDNLPSGAAAAQTKDETGIISYETKIEEDGDYTADIYFNNSVQVQGIRYVVMVNGQYLDFDFQKNDTVRDLGHLEKGDTISVEVTALVNGVVCRPLRIYRLDRQVFENISKTVNENAPQNIANDRGVIRAQTDFDKNRLIFTTLAYSDGFDVYIDGKKTDKTSAFGTFLCFEVPAGKHDIAIKYITPGIISGGCISLCTLIILLICFYMRKNQKKKAEV